MVNNYTVGFIGGGAMAEAIISGAVSNGVLPAENIFVSDLNQERVSLLKEKYGVNAYLGANEFINKVNLVLLAIKPQVAMKAMEQVAGKQNDSAVVASIVAGLKLEKIEKFFPESSVIRIMPNTPLAVGAGMSAYALGTKAKAEDATVLVEILSACGKAIEVQESMMDAVTGLSGSAPAYVFLMIDALSDGGVAAGLPRKTATMLAAQTLFGAAKMVLDTGRHPDDLRDQVTSPAGTTIAGVRVMEQQGVRAALIDAVIAATDRSKELGK